MKRDNASMIYDNEKIEALRVKKGLSGNKLGALAGISGPSMHAILNGDTKKVDYNTLTGIALALGVPIQVILKGDKSKHDPVAEAAAVFSRLTPSDQLAMLATMTHLASQQKK